MVFCREGQSEGGRLRSLPISWRVEALNNLCEVILGQSPPSSTYNEQGIGLPFYQGKLEFGDMHPTPRKWCTAPKKIAQTGDVLISVRAPVGPTNICPEKSVIGRGLAAVRGLGGIEPRFVLYALRAFESDLAGKGTGSTFAAISGDQLKQFPVPLPPLPEQHRIVAKIEELFSDLDAGVEALKKVKAELKRYRQAVVKAAVEGKLTEEWRRGRGDSETGGRGDAGTGRQGEGSVADLLERIRAERAKNAKGKKLPPIDTSVLPKLPEGWEWTRLGHIAEMCLGKMLDKNKNKGEYQSYLRNINVRWGAFDLSDLSQMKFEEDEERRYGLVPGDLVVCEGGEPGRAAVWSGAPGMKIQKALHRVRFLENTVVPEFLRYYLEYSAQNGILIKYFTGTTIKHLTGIRLAELMFPLPSYTEQHQIVSEVEQRLSVADEVEKTVEAGLKEAERLRQSILKKAFEGKLVPQDPSDEPASVLLERIRIAREEHKKSGSSEGAKNRGRTLEARIKKEKKR